MDEMKEVISEELITLLVPIHQEIRLPRFLIALSNIYIN